jgi:sec-independent protein translocase protein TatA
VDRRLEMFGLNHTELLIFLVIALLLFGGSRIPSIARSLGKSITEFKKGMQGIEDEINNPSDDTPKKVDA